MLNKSMLSAFLDFESRLIVKENKNLIAAVNRKTTKQWDMLNFKILNVAVSRIKKIQNWLDSQKCWRIKLLSIVEKPSKEKRKFQIV